MRRVLPLIALVSLSFAPAPFPRTTKADSEKDLNLLRGAWFVSDTEAARFEGDRLTYSRPNDGKITSSYRVKLDASARPKQLDLIGGPVRSGTIVRTFLHRGIYVIEKETITICTANAHEERPTRFDRRSDKDKHWNVSVFKRKKH